MSPNKVLYECNIWQVISRLCTIGNLVIRNDKLFSVLFTFACNAKSFAIAFLLSMFLDGLPKDF